MFPYSDFHENRSEDVVLLIVVLHDISFLSHFKRKSNDQKGTHSGFRFRPKLVFQWKVHSTKKYEPKDEESDDPNTHHKMKVCPIPRGILATTATLQIAQGDFQVDPEWQKVNSKF